MRNSTQNTNKHVQLNIMINSTYFHHENRMVNENSFLPLEIPQKHMRNSTHYAFEQKS